MAVHIGPVIADRVRSTAPTSKSTLTSQNVMDLISGKATVGANRQGPLKTGYVTASQAQKAANDALAKRVAAATPAPAPGPGPGPTPGPNQSPAVEQVTSSEPASGDNVQIQPEPIPAETGNPAVDQANVLASILNSPLYTESIKNAYLTQYLPGLTQANYEINKARAQEVQNSFLRQQAQAQAIREVAGSYAARGLRTPKMVTEGFAPIQQATELERTAAEQTINDLIANKEVLYGAGAKDSETFITDPTMFGSIGSGARRSALGELLQLPEMYGLTQVANASRSPFGGGQQPANEAPDLMPKVPTGGQIDTTPTGPTSPTNYDTKAASQIQARIDAANKYIRQQQAKNNAKTVAGAQQKLSGYEAELKKIRGY